MRDLIIIAKFPTKGKSKTRLGKTIGYSESSYVAKLLLEDLIQNASQVCNVTLASPEEDADKFAREYPLMNIYGGSKTMVSRLAGSIKYYYDQQRSDKFIAITGDIVAGEKEIDQWFKYLNKHNLLIGPTFDFRFYQIGMDKKFGKHFSKNLFSFPDSANFIYTFFKSMLYLPKIKINKIKRDIDTIDDLKKVAYAPNDFSKKTREYVLDLINKNKKNNY